MKSNRSLHIPGLHRDDSPGESGAEDAALQTLALLRGAIVVAERLESGDFGAALASQTHPSPVSKSASGGALLGLAVASAFLLAGFNCATFAANSANPAAILLDLRSFREFATVLYVAAHPDDEDTQLITFLARGRGYRAAYLSVTRGDGGQNVLGPEFDEQLGVIRTQELLAARRLDGGRQFFTRAIDFGYSKNYQETLAIWDKQQAVSDVVRVIRTFRPDVVIAGFAPQQTPGNHGHHVASAFLAVDAFKLAGDPKAFPEQLGDLKPWQPKRLLQNFRFGGRGGGGNPAAGPHLEISGNDPVLGISFNELASRSRSQHKTQFGVGGGFGGGGGTRNASFLVLDGAPATNDIMDGVDTTWNRVPGGSEIGRLADDAIAQFNPTNSAASIPALLAIHGRLATLPGGDRIVDEKRTQLDRIIQSCLGLSVETTVPQAEVVPGEELKLHHTATVSSGIPVRWVAVRYPGVKRELNKPIDLRANEAATRDSEEKLPANTPLSQPYWLREERTTGMYQVADASLIGTPENPPVFPVEQIFEVGGQTLVIPDQPVQLLPDRPEPQQRRPLAVIPPVTLKFPSEVKLFAPGAANPVEVEVVAFRPGVNGTLQLDAPAGWKITPASQPFKLKAVGDRVQLTFTVTAPLQRTSAPITARTRIGDATFDNDRVEIRYDHIPVQLLQPPAHVHAVALDLSIRGKKVGYLPGAGDSVAECIGQMGYAVTQLTGADLTTNRLKDFDAVVIGVRAFNVRNDLAPHLPALFDYVEAGGTVVAQYNRPDNARTFKVAPYDLRLSGERVTDETAAMTFLAPEHPALNTPNKITSADFDGWFQERGIYFPNQWDDEHFKAILACNDPGEAPKSGSLLIAQYGKGYFVYTSLVFFRELPDGVPGAYRLFANLMSLGK